MTSSHTHAAAPTGIFPRALFSLTNLFSGNHSSPLRPICPSSFQPLLQYSRWHLRCSVTFALTTAHISEMSGEDISSVPAALNPNTLWLVRAAALSLLVLWAAVAWWEGVNYRQCQKWRNTCRKVSTWKRPSGGRSTVQTPQLLLMTTYTGVNRAAFPQLHTDMYAPAWGCSCLNIPAVLKQDKSTSLLMSSH